MLTPTKEAAAAAARSPALAQTNPMLLLISIVIAFALLVAWDAAADDSNLS